MLSLTSPEGNVSETYKVGGNTEHFQDVRFSELWATRHNEEIWKVPREKV
jgi:hypothetical protein